MERERQEEALENQQRQSEDSPGPDSAVGDPNEVDPNAWDIPGLPQRDLENYRSAQAGESPQGYEAESNSYMRELARAFDRYRRQRGESQPQENRESSSEGDE